MSKNDLNRCDFIGRLGQDPEVRYVGDTQRPVANFSIAVGMKWKDKESTEWIRIAVFGKLAEICGEYLSKGSQIYVSGRLRSRKWTDINDVERTSTEIIVGSDGTIQFLGGGDPRGTGGSQGPGPDRQHSGPAQSGDKPFDPDDDIPF